jgi:hypothetical protein
VFVLDAGTFLVSYWLIARVSLVDHVEGDEAESGARFRDALRLPIVRSVGPAALLTALGLGTLFSLGVVFVREVLGASTLEFAVLIALFGVGAGFGLAGLSAAGPPDVGMVRFCIAAQGVIVAAMSQVPTVWAAFLGAVLFGAATAAGLAAAMSILQENLGERDRVLAFTAFHVLIRAGLALAALGAGLAGDVLGQLQWPLLGTLPPARAVLLVSGVLVAATSIFVRVPSPSGAVRAT